MALIIHGRKKAGYGFASNTIRIQFPRLLGEYEEISKCFKATINIELDERLIVLNPDFRTSPIKWHPEMRAGEVFDFLKVKLLVKRLNIEVDAWIYIAHGSEHRNHLNIHEILCEKIDGLNDSEPFQITIERDFKLLPYHQKILIV